MRISIPRFLMIVVIVLSVLAVRQWRKEEAISNRAYVWFEAHNVQEAICVEAVKYAPFSFGPSKVEFLIDSKLIYVTEVSDDGGTLTEEHFSFYWHGNNILNVILKGREQKNEYIEFKFENEQIWVNGILVD